MGNVLDHQVGEIAADLMIEYGVGVIDEQTDRVKRISPE